MRSVLVPLLAMLVIQAAGALSNLALPVMAPEAAPAFGLDASQIGLYTGIMYIGGSLSTLVSGGFVTRWGPIRVSQASLLLSAAGLLLIPPGIALLLPLSAFLIGLGYGPMTPASSHILARKSPPGSMSLIFSIKQTGVPAGFALAGSLIPVVVLAYGWQAGAFVSAAICIALAAVLQPIRAAYDDDRGAWRPFSISSVTGPLRLVVSHRPLRRMAIGSFAFASMQVGITAFLVTYLAESVGLGLVAAGTALSTAQAAAIVGRVGWGALADRTGAPRLLLALLAFGMSASTVAAALITTAWPFVAILAVCATLGATVIGWNGVALAETARQAPPGRVGEATGGVLCITFSGVIVGPPLLSLLVALTGDYVTGFLLLAAATAAVGIMFLTPEEPTPVPSLKESD